MAVSRGKVTPLPHGEVRKAVNIILILTGRKQYPMPIFQQFNLWCDMNKSAILYTQYIHIYIYFFAHICYKNTQDDMLQSG